MTSADDVYPAWIERLSRRLGLYPGAIVAIGVIAALLLGSFAVERAFPSHVETARFVYFVVLIGLGLLKTLTERPRPTWWIVFMSLCFAGTIITYILGG